MASESTVLSDLYVEYSRDEWSRLQHLDTSPIDSEEFERLRSLDDPVGLDEATEVYSPLAQLIHLYVLARRDLRRSVTSYLEKREPITPFVVGIAGSVAAGKSTTARILRSLLARIPEHSIAQLVTTDGFLLSNAELEARGIMMRKGFPESYDQRGLIHFLADLKSGQTGLSVPVYSHLVYDIVPDERVVIGQPDIVILEGLNVLQIPEHHDGPTRFAVSDFFDLSIYVDATQEDLEQWFISRFLRLRETAFKDPRSFFKALAELSDDQAIETGRQIWHNINEVNLLENILPTRNRADVVLSKMSDHRVNSVRLRKF